MVRYDTSPGQRFQSTPPARGATVPFQLQAIEVDISIHAPREGGDLFLRTAKCH